MDLSHSRRVRRHLAAIRAVLAASVALAFVASLTSEADAARRQNQRNAPKPGKQHEPKGAPFDGRATGTLQIIVSIGNQHVSLYSNGTKIAQAPVSTGTHAKPTPTGVFSIIQKDRYHRSNLYDNAPMYYMHRITWSGVAMHEGALPGVPASHGCIRLPTNFVSRLWQVSSLGVRVIVSPSDLAPVDIEHPRLFVPRQKPADTTADLMNDVLRPALAETRDSAVRPIRFAQFGAAANPSALDIPPPPPPAPAVEETYRLPSTPDVNTTATVNPDPSKPNASSAAAPAGTPEKPLELRLSTGEPEKILPEDLVEPNKTPAGPYTPGPRNRNNRVNTEPSKRSGHIAVFVSRKEKKVFVRQGFVPLFDMPVEIANPTQPLGTHVFTALAFRNDGSLRWNLISMRGDQPHTPTRQDNQRGRGKAARAQQPVPAPAGDSRNAVRALERIQLPQAAVDRISELLKPGSSLTISDEGLGRETAKGTDFIVLTR